VGALDGFSRLLLAWTAAINLTAIREPVAVATEHLLDSLTATSLLAQSTHARILDLGSGGGLPGIPLAVALPTTSVLLVDSIGKKTMFLRAAVAALGLHDHVAVMTSRAEDVARRPERGTFDFVTVRAVASLPELIELALPLLRVGGSLIAWKRGDLAAELAAGRRAARVLGGGDVATHPVPLAALADHRLLTIRKERQTGNRFPRSPTDRRATLL
jgi:16S rRNA (guanine527-N7)-methyltransferase